LKDKLLITGGAGYIGSILSAYFLDRGFEVHVIDDLSSGSLNNLDKRAIFYQGSILDTRLLQESMQRVTAVFHCAAKSLVSESIHKSELYNQVNVEGTGNLLTQMKSLDIHKLIFSSTCAVYGQPEQIPISEKSTTVPISPYGVSKLKADKLITESTKNGNLSAISFRFFNIAGSYENNEGIWFNETRENETHLIPNLIKSEPSEVFEVFGIDYPTHDGSCVRDFLHIKDLARAYELALNNNLNNPEHQIINLGSGAGTSVLEVIAITEEVLKRRIKVLHSKSREGDPATLVAYIEKAKQILDWQPELDIRQIIQSAWQGYSKVR
jgi:UDP-glucose 4-epimerase